jgi:hypothetical protein
MASRTHTLDHKKIHYKWDNSLPRPSKSIRAMSRFPINNNVSRHFS